MRPKSGQNQRFQFIDLLSTIGVLWGFWTLFPVTASSQTITVRSSSSCPTELELLVESLLPELPSYINRELQRSRHRGVVVGSPSSNDPNASSYTLFAGKPEFEPLPLGIAQSSIDTEEHSAEPVSQVFITTLERTYLDHQLLEFQGYHWLFLTQASNGWRLVTIFSSWGSYPADGKTTPPQESSQSAVGQGIRTWLRDCRYSANSPQTSG